MEAVTEEHWTCGFWGEDCTHVWQAALPGQLPHRILEGLQTIMMMMMMMMMIIIIIIVLLLLLCHYYYYYYYYCCCCYL